MDVKKTCKIAIRTRNGWTENDCDPYLLGLDLKSTFEEAVQRHFSVNFLVLDVCYD